MEKVRIRHINADNYKSIENIFNQYAEKGYRLSKINGNDYYFSYSNQKKRRYVIAPQILNYRSTYDSSVPYSYFSRQTIESMLCFYKVKYEYIYGSNGSDIYCLIEADDIYFDIVSEYRDVCVNHQKRLYNLLKPTSFFLLFIVVLSIISGFFQIDWWCAVLMITSIFFVSTKYYLSNRKTYHGQQTVHYSKCFSIHNAHFYIELFSALCENAENTLPIEYKTSIKKVKLYDVNAIKKNQNIISVSTVNTLNIPELMWVAFVDEFVKIYPLREQFSKREGIIFLKALNLFLEAEVDSTRILYQLARSVTMKNEHLQK